MTSFCENFFKISKLVRWQMCVIYFRSPSQEYTEERVCWWNGRVPREFDQEEDKGRKQEGSKLNQGDLEKSQNKKKCRSRIQYAAIQVQQPSPMSILLISLPKSLTFFTILMSTCMYDNGCRIWCLDSVRTSVDWQFNTSYSIWRLLSI